MMISDKQDKHDRCTADCLSDIGDVLEERTADKETQTVNIITSDTETQTSVTTTVDMEVQTTEFNLLVYHNKDVTIH